LPYATHYQIIPYLLFIIYYFFIDLEGGGRIQSSRFYSLVLFFLNLILKIITLFLLLLLLLFILGVNFMKKISLLRVIAAVAVLTPAISANAALVDYNEQFVANNILYNLNFQADDTIITVITTFNGTAGTDALTLAPIGLFGYSDNWFDPATIATRGGWNHNGL
jgi:hypothetical protein